MHPLRPLPLPQAYGRALELAPGRLYCLIQCGTIRAALGAHREGVADFEGALAIDPSHPAALLGAAEALAAQARLDLQRGVLGEARAGWLGLLCGLAAMLRLLQDWLDSAGWEGRDGRSRI